MGQALTCQPVVEGSSQLTFCVRDGGFNPNSGTVGRFAVLPVLDGPVIITDDEGI